MTSPRLAEETGRVLGGRYRLMAPVGVGTSSRVFLAVDTQLRRRVAVKLLHEALAGDEAFLRRFRAEARAAGALSHPNLLAVFDWGEDHDDGRIVPYLVTEYLGGGSLRDLLDEHGRLTPSQTLVVGLDAARGLAHAHQRGLVHRDVKPGNLLFDDERRLRLADFGLARALAEASWTEPSGVAVGTARYASPEQAMGRRLDGRSDVYSLGLVLAECVSGQVPFAGETTAVTLARRTQGDLELDDSYGRLRGVLEHAGRLDPAERPDAAEFEVALMAAAQELPRPEPLPIVPTVADAEATTELNLIRNLDGVSVLAPDESPPVVVDPTPDDELDLDEADGSLSRDADLPSEQGVPERSPITVAEEHELLSASRPSSFGPVAPLVEDPDRPTTADGEPAPRRRRRRWWLLALLLVVALGAGSVTAWWFLVRVPVHDVPDLLGQEIAAAEAAAEEFGWPLGTPTFERRDGSSPGEILAQDPAPGTELAEGETLAVVLSLGQTLVGLPDVTGRPLEEAEAAIAEAGLALGEVTTAFDEEIPPGHVVSASTASEPETVDGEPVVERDTAMALVVSDGPAPRAVPDGLQGARFDDAVAALAEVQLEGVRGLESYDENVPEGRVISVSEPP
jgi:eukaryotic-like serine/threonine-protein kinase